MQNNRRSGISRRFWNVEDADYENPGPRRMRRMVKIIDSGGFNKTVFFVSSSGFLASSYGLFATNVIKPALYYVYPPCGRLNSNAGVVIDQLTLIGTALGMLCAGHFADLWGRKKLYGFELAILVIATLGVVQASEGFQSQNPNGMYENTMNIYSWISWWRFVLGIGIGAEGTIIAAEWAATKSRGRMLAAVYSMQAVARLLAFGICLAALHAIGSRNDISPDALDEKPFNMKRVVDQVWRWVTGVAIIPAALAIGLRLTIPETPRYYADIRNNMAKAIKKALQVYGQQGLEDEPADNFDELSRHDSDSIEEEDHWYRDAWRYLTTTIAGRHLIVISGLWAIMDLGWYGLSMDSPSALSTLWHDPSTPIIQSPSTNTRRLAEGVCPEFNSWRTDPNSNITIYRVLENNSIRSMLVVSIGSLLGNMALIIIINRFHRKNILITTFCLISLFLAITGGSLIGTYRAGQDHLAATVFFGIMHFLFTIGPKTLILVMAVEMFPTFYRGTFYGIAAATGKVGAIIIRAIIGRTGNGEMALGIRLFSVIPLMLLGAWMSSLLPEVQHVPKKSDTEAAINESSIVERKDKLKINEGSSNEHELKLLRDGGEKLRMSFRGLIFLQKLQDMTLEEIAPNPAVALANYGREIRQ